MADNGVGNRYKTIAYKVLSNLKVKKGLFRIRLKVASKSSRN